MSMIQKIIKGMNKEEIRFFKLYVSRTQDNSERKDVLLFDYVRKSGKNYDEDYILKKLYRQKNKNAFYRLKNRLMSDINTSLYLQHFDEDEDVHIHHLISMSKFYYNRNEPKLSLSFLKKAEAKAEMHEKYELLDVVYTNFIGYSLEFSDISVDEYIKMRKENAIQLNKIKQINEILAAVSYKLKSTDDLTSINKPIFPLLKKTIDDISNDVKLKNSKDLRLRIYETVSKILLQKRDYATLEVYLLTTYLQFNEDGLFDKQSHHIKLQMLSGFIETLYNNRKYDRALSYVSKLEEAMRQYNDLLHDDYLFTYYNALVKNYSASDQKKAIDLLEKLKTDKEFSQITDYEIYIFLSLAIIWFERKDFHKAIANIYKLYMYDSYTKTGDRLKYKAVVTELIIRYELGDFEYIEYRTQQLKEEFEKFLAEEDNVHEKVFLDVLKLLASQQGTASESIVKKRIHEFPKDYEQKFDEIKFIDYAQWLHKQIN